MNPAIPLSAPIESSDAEHWASSEVRLLPDGRILAHHLTPELAAILARVAGQPEDSFTTPGAVPAPDVTPHRTDPAEAPHHVVLH